MQLIEQNDRFVAVASYEERAIPKEASFRWDPARKQWWTSDTEKAGKLARYASADLAPKLAAVKQEKAEAFQQSKATDCDHIEVPCPDGLAYLPYQKAGIAFGMARPGVLIADEMGLGKTIQAIGIFNADPTIKRVLILCPASLKLNWAREWKRWSTRRCRVGIARGGDFPVHADILICNYDIIAKSRQKVDQIEWDLLVVDECHALKNNRAQRTKAVLGGGKRGDDRVEPIKARRRIFLTGTPIMNRPAELWTLVHSLDPKGIGGDFWGFHKRYCNAHNSGYGWDFSGASNLDELQRRLRETIMVRRLKSEVLTELPAKRRQLMVIDPGDAIGAVQTERSSYEALQDRAQVLAAQVELADAAGDTAAYDNAVAELKAAQTALFSEISRLRHATAVAKIPHVIDHLRESIEGGGKVVCFAHHIDVVTALQREFGCDCVVLTGQTAITDRQAAVDRFQTDPSCRLFIGNILAAGVGITLTAAAHVVFAELDWRPGIVTQAEDRCHRIGQRGSVLVQHLVFDESLDAKMAQTIVAKQAVIDAALDDDIQEHAEEEHLPLTGGPEAAPKRALIQPTDTAFTAERIMAIHTGLRTLAAMDQDRARAINGVGFSKFDGTIGHSLAETRSLSAKQAALGLKLIRKYRRQLGDDLIEQAMGR